MKILSDAAKTRHSQHTHTHTHTHTNYSSDGRWNNKVLKKSSQGFPGGSVYKESICTARRPSFDPWVWRIPWRRKWQPTPVFLSGESHRQRRLADYNPWSHKELDTTKWLIHHHHQRKSPNLWGVWNKYLKDQALDIDFKRIQRDF